MIAILTIAATAWSTVNALDALCIILYVVILTARADSLRDTDRRLSPYVSRSPLRDTKMRYEKYPKVTLG
jgi:hypothetical protein